MKKENGKIVSVLLGRLIIIGFAAQIVFGIVYTARNIGYVQMFGDAAENVAVSGRFVCDVYTGVLYPAVLLIVRAAMGALQLPWYSFMYLLQLTLGITAGYIFLREFGKERFGRGLYFYGSLVIATSPLILQSHLAILSGSFAFSFLMLETAYMRNAWGSRQMSDSRGFCFELGRVCLFWLLAALTEWDFLIVGAVPVVTLLVRAVFVLAHTDRKRIVFPFIILMSFTVLIIGSYGLTKSREEKASPAKSIEVSLFDRVCWKTFLYRDGSLRYSLWEAAGTEAIEEAGLHRAAVKTVLEPVIEDNLGTDGAKKLFLELAGQAWETNKGEILHDAATDMAGYIIAPVITEVLLEGRTFISYTSRNFDIFKRNCPVLARYYLDFSFFWFAATLMIAGVLWILKLFTAIREKKKPGTGMGAVITTIVTAVILSVRNVFLGSGVYDYKLAVFTSALWVMLILFSTNEKETRIKEKSETEENAEIKGNAETKENAASEENR